jgi:hypothetical protein
MLIQLAAAASSRGALNPLENAQRAHFLTRQGSAHLIQIGNEKRRTVLESTWTYSRQAPERPGANQRFADRGRRTVQPEVSAKPQL